MKMEMTDLQKAYYLGEKENFVLGGSSAVIYFSFVIHDFCVDTFQRALNIVVNKHQLLHSFLNEENLFEEGFIKEVPVDYLEKGGLEIEEWIHQEMDLHKIPLFRVLVENQEVKKATIHFIISGLILDGWSVDLLIQQIQMAYLGESLPEIEIADYKEYAKAMVDYKNTFWYEDDSRYFEQLIQKYPPREFTFPFLTLPENIKKAKSNTVTIKIGNDVWNGVKEYCKQAQVTPFVLSMTIFSYIINKYTGLEQFYLNIPSGVRSEEVENIEHTIGLCSNFILFPITIKRELSLAENARINQDRMFDIQEHIFYPGTDAIRYMQKVYNMAMAAPVVFTSMLEFGLKKENDFYKTGWNIHTNQVMMEADLIYLNKEACISISYVQNLFDSRMIEKIAKMFVHALEQKDDWEKYSLVQLLPEDVKKIEQFNATESTVYKDSMKELLMKSFKQYQNSIAVINEGIEYTYLDIEKMTKRLMKKLTLLANDKEVIGILLPKGVWQIVSALATIYLDFIYMPIEVELSQAQINYCIENVGVKAVITNEELASKITTCDKIIKIEEILQFHNGKDEKYDFKQTSSGLDDVRIIINTSGSSGYPKSIMLKEKSIVNCLLYTLQIFDIHSNDRAFAITNFCHDMAIFDTLGMFLCGGSIVIPDADKIKEPFHWMELIEKYSVSVWNSVPSFMEMLFLSGKSFSNKMKTSLKRIILGGEFLKTTLAKKIKNEFLNVVLYNVGGPSETTIWNIYHEVTQEDIQNGVIPYGKPFPNTRYDILNNHNELCPVGVTGVMYCRGIGISKGYIGLEEETRRCFYSLEQGQTDIGYLTGDLGYLRDDGEMMIVGRADFQVKIHGKRIELQAIEKVLCDNEEIQTYIVIEVSKKLVAFYVSDLDLEEQKLMEELKQKLPDYMIPKQFIRLSAIPMTLNGKPDRKQLKEIAQQKQSQEVNKPVKKEAHSLRTQLLQMVEEILGCENFDEKMNFFAAGGDSLAAVRISASIYSIWNVEVSVYEILNTYSIEEWMDLVVDMLDENKKG